MHKILIIFIYDLKYVLIEVDFYGEQFFLSL